MLSCVRTVPRVLVCGAGQRARSTAPTVRAREMRRSALRPPRSAIVRLRSGAVASRSGAFRIAAFRCGGGGPRGWHGRAAVFGAPPLCHRESAFLRDGQSIRRYGALGLVAMPPCANRIRPGGVLPLAASDSLWPRGRRASPHHGRDPPRASKVRSGRRCGGARRSERQTAGRGRRRRDGCGRDGRYSDRALRAIHGGWMTRLTPDARTGAERAAQAAHNKAQR